MLGDKESDQLDLDHVPGVGDEDIFEKEKAPEKEKKRITRKRKYPEAEEYARRQEESAEQERKAEGLTRRQEQQQEQELLRSQTPGCDAQSNYALGFGGQTPVACCYGG